MKDDKKWAVGIDLGGTKIRGGIVSSDGSLLSQPFETATEEHRGRDVIQNNLFRTIDEILNQAKLCTQEITGIGVGTPGPLDLKTGTILNAPNLPSMRGYSIKQQVESKYSIPVLVHNDANCYVLGEALFGSGRGSSVVAGLTLGTGLGCGLVLWGKVFEGATGTAAEIWKTPYEGKTFEEIVSSRGLSAMYKERSGENQGAVEISKKAFCQEAAAILAWEEFGRHLGIILAYIINLIDPDIIVLGGSISKSFELFRKTMELSYRFHINPVPGEHVRVEPGSLGKEGGLMGAAALCFSAQNIHGY